MISLGIPYSQIVLAAEQTLYMVFISLAIGTAAATRSFHKPENKY
ncbi:hypothetical protein [Pectinatus frisingensis]|nr:hypothetical protein [Pectinatus frisingensis]